ncbi:hypothetical protein [Cytobacillus depressus]|nr:hypothetical protein [Cytobacillus depressus]
MAGDHPPVRVLAAVVTVLQAAIRMAVPAVQAAAAVAVLKSFLNME